MKQTRLKFPDGRNKDVPIKCSICHRWMRMEPNTEAKSPSSDGLKREYVQRVSLACEECSNPKV